MQIYNNKPVSFPIRIIDTKTKVSQEAKSSLIIRSCDSLKDLKKFVQFPFRLYKFNPYWVPSMKDDELKALQPGTNPAFSNCDAKF